MNNTKYPAIRSNYIPEYICSDCAKKRGGDWVNGQKDIKTKDFCEICEDFLPVAHKSNWFFGHINYGGFGIP